LQFRVSLP
jgi:hypothetical protein